MGEHYEYLYQPLLERSLLNYQVQYLAARARERYEELIEESDAQQIPEPMRDEMERIVGGADRILAGGGRDK